MSIQRQYFPVLKGKRGDFWALENLKPTTCDLVTPLIEVVPPGPKKSKSKPSSESPELRQAKSTVKQIKKCWGDRPCLVDALWIDPQSSPLPGHTHAVDEFFQEARNGSIQAIPVTSLTRSPAYQNAIARVTHEDNRGMAVRLSSDLFENVEVLRRALNRLLDLTGLTPSSVDLFVDLNSVVNISPSVVGLGWRNAISKLPELSEWRTLAVLAGSFPPTLAKLERSAWTTLPRREWAAWRSLITASDLPRVPAYSDYAIGDPDLPYSGPGPSTSVNLRYSTNDNFLIWRGYSTKKGEAPAHLGCSQIYSICADLVGRAEFRGEGFSQGDLEIHQRATIQGSTGNVQQWRQWATNHYIELVVSQIASLP